MCNWSPRRKGEREWGRRNIWWNNGGKLPNSDQRHEIMDLGSSMCTTNRINTKKTTAKHIIIKLLKTEGKEKILKAARAK